MYDMAGTLEGVDVFLNGEKIQFSFEEYVQQYPVATPNEEKVEENDMGIVKRKKEREKLRKGPLKQWVVKKANPRWQAFFLCFLFVYFLYFF